jgi:group II intron reverse transcriptase/maturase
METKLEGIAAKARKEPNLKFTSLCHHITKELIWGSLCKTPLKSAPGIDGITVKMAKESFNEWIDKMIQSIHRKGYKAPAVRRVWIPKPGKNTKRPLGVPAIADRALQRSTATVLSEIYEQDFLACSFGGRPGLGAHNALATLNEVISGKKVSWILEADLKNYFGSLDHGWLLRFVEHRVGDPRILSLIKRWLKAGVMENGEFQASEEGTPQGGSISVLLSNIYLHYVLDLWFENVVKRRLRGEAYLIRYIDDFIVCFQYRSDALKFQNVLEKRLGKFSLQLEPSKTQLIEFGRFAKERAFEKGKKLQTLYFLGFTHFCKTNKKGKFMIGRKIEKSRYKRACGKLKTCMLENRHQSVRKQAERINQILRGLYAYYGIGGNIQSLKKLYRVADRYWRCVLSSRSQKGSITWARYTFLKKVFPLQQPKIYLSHAMMENKAVL